MTEWTVNNKLNDWYQKQYHIKLPKNYETKSRLYFSTAPVSSFSPIDLFATGSKGIWLDPSDLSTMFSDRAGTTPVTTPGTVVGLRLDKSKGLVLGSELVTNGTFGSGTTTGWTATSSTLSVDTGRLKILSVATYGWAYQAFTTVVGRTYRLNYSLTNGDATACYLYVDPVAGTGAANYDSGVKADGTYTAVFVATATTTYVKPFIAGAGKFAFYDNISVKELAGNHAVAPTDAARPIYGVEPKGGRRNLLTWSEGFDNAYWVKTGLQAFGSGSTANATTAPDGTLTADFICENSASGNHRVNSPGISYVAGTSLTATVRVKSTTRNYSPYIGNASGAVTATFNLSNGTVSVAASNIGTASGATATITQDAQGFWLCTLSGVVSASSSTDASIFHQIVNGTSASYTGDGASGIFIWGAQLELGSTATNYQRVLSAYDVTESGVATTHYVQYDGSDDSMSTAAIDFTATDKMSVFAGVRKLSDATGQILYEFSPSVVANANSFAMYAGGNASAQGALWTGQNRGNGASVSSEYNAVAGAPVSTILTAQFAIQSTPRTVMRANGSVIGTLTGSADTGNFGNYPLFIGRRNNATLPFNGRDYGIIIVGKAASAGEITDTETWLAARTSGVTL